MDTTEHKPERFQSDQLLRQRLRIVADRLDTAEWERNATIVAAHRQGLSVRQIATAVRLSPARVHQLLHAPASTRSMTSDVWKDALTTASTGSDVPAAAAAALLRECTDWLERLDRGESVVVNVRDASQRVTEYVAVDRPQVRRVLQRLARDLEDYGAAGGASREDSALSRRALLADLVPPPRPLSPHEERKQLRRQLGLDA